VLVLRWVWVFLFLTGELGAGTCIVVGVCEPLSSVAWMSVYGSLNNVIPFYTSSRAYYCSLLLLLTVPATRPSRYTTTHFSLSDLTHLRI
jgi:hypothetical protein